MTRIVVASAADVVAERSGKWRRLGEFERVEIKEGIRFSFSIWLWLEIDVVFKMR